MKTKLFSLILIAALSASFIGTAFSQPQPRDKKGFFKEHMLEKLNLTDEQKSKIDEIRINHQKSMIDLKANLEKKMLALKELRLKDNIDRNAVINAVKDINEAKNNIAISRANNMMDIYEVLTPEQRKNWKDKMGPFNEQEMHGKNFRHGMEGNESMPMHKKMQ